MKKPNLFESIKKRTLILKEGKKTSKWYNSEYEEVKISSTTKKGNWGEDVSKLLWKSIDVDCEIKTGRRGDWDTKCSLKLISKTFENKLATEDTNGSFQFNGIKLNRDYDYLFCLGVSPNEVFYKIIPKSEIENKTSWGFCSMTRKNVEEDKMSLSYKLSVKKENMTPISLFDNTLLSLF